MDFKRKKKKKMRALGINFVSHAPRKEVVAASDGQGSVAAEEHRRLGWWVPQLGLGWGGENRGTGPHRKVFVGFVGIIF